MPETTLALPELMRALLAVAGSLAAIGARLPVRDIPAAFGIAADGLLAVIEEEGTVESADKITINRDASVSRRGRR